MGPPMSPLMLMFPMSRARPRVCGLLWVTEPAATLQWRDWGLLALLGLGPLGASFFMWDKALKLGDARQIGILSYITPLASTSLLVLVSGRPFSSSIIIATAMILGAAVLGMRAR